MYKIPSRPIKEHQYRNRLNVNAFSTTNECDYVYTQDDLYQKYLKLSYADRIEYEERCSHAGIMLNLFDDFNQEESASSTKKLKLVEQINKYIFMSEEETKDVYDPCTICHKKILGKEFSVESKACCRRKVHSDCLCDHILKNDDDECYCPSCNVCMYTEEYLEKCKESYPSY